MEERRLLLAVGLSFLVLIGYRMLFVPEPSPRPPGSPAATEPLEAPGATPPAAEAATPAPTAVERSLPEAQATPEPQLSLPRVAAELEERIEVSTGVARLAFTNRGARLVSWRLLRYPDQRGNPEEMVRTVPGHHRPLDMVTDDPELNSRLTEALFVPSATTLEVTAGQTQELRFEYAEGTLRAEKSIEFDGEGYVVRVRARVERGGQALAVRLLWGPGLGNPSEKEQDVFGYVRPQAVLMTDEGLERIPPGKFERWQGSQGGRWGGVEAMYFTALWVPEQPRGSVRLDVAEVLPPGEDEPEKLPEVAFELSGGDSVSLYVGPKDYHVLSELDRGLAKVVPVGDWIGPVVVPLLRLLRYVYAHIGNYGWSILALTLLINVAMAPLRHYSIANGLKMAKLAPEMKVIQERYKKIPALDPRRQEMQKEVAALYARHGMSMSTQMTVGCLPILLTMPFLIAFYRVLMVSIDLRGAAFLWIPDLSQKDPLYLTPILMGVSMLAMQRMTPTTMDPAQQRIMLIMPLVLVVMFFSAPAGLNLYWLSSNLCSIVQQGATQKLLRGRQQPPAPAKAERSRKRRK